MSNLGPQRSHPTGRREALSPARQEVLDLLVDADGGLTVADVAHATSSHPNTAREHLDALVQAGHLARAQLPAVGRGRPPMIYRALPRAREVGPQYRALAEMLVEYLVEQTPDAEVRTFHSREAGERWASRRESEDDVASLLASVDPVPVPGTVASPDGTDGITLRLRRCPVLDLARRHSDVVCSVHLGLLRGVLAKGLDVDDIELHPFAEPGACLVHFPPFQKLPPAAFAFLAGAGLVGEGDGETRCDGDQSEIPHVREHANA